MLCTKKSYRPPLFVWLMKQDSPHFIECSEATLNNIPETGYLLISVSLWIFLRQSPSALTDSVETIASLQSPSEPPPFLTSIPCYSCHRWNIYHVCGPRRITRSNQIWVNLYSKPDMSLAYTTCLLQIADHKYLLQVAEALRLEIIFKNVTNDEIIVKKLADRSNTHKSL